MPDAPIARRDAGADPYRWLERRDDPEVVAHLRAENAYLEASLAEQADLRERLFQEIKGRIRETDLSLPSPWGPYLYYQRTTAGDEYPRHYRCPRPAGESLAVDEAREELLLDPNALAGDGFLDVGDLSISPDQRLLAYSLDRSGDESYALYVKDLASGEVTALPFERCDGSLVWANDNRTLFFIELDDTQRPWCLYRHRLGEPGAQRVFEEAAPRFFLSCYRSSSERQLILELGSKTTREAWVLDAGRPDGDFACLAPREEGHEYEVDHGRIDGDWGWLIRSNQSGLNFALYSATGDAPPRSTWRERLAHDPQVMIDGFCMNASAYVLSLRVEGLPVLQVQPEAQPSYRVRLPDAAYGLHVSDSLEFDSPAIRLRYEALNRPAQIRRLDLASGAQTVLKQTPVEGPFDPEDYLSLRLWARAADGTAVPISLVGRRDLFDGDRPKAPAPLYLYGYGAYGACIDPWFSHARLSLLERGCLFAIAHVRGGGELGEAWYRAGKLAHKQTTFDDFIACAEHLVDAGFTRPDRLAISGGSAGGLLIGAVLNQRPALFAAAIADVPFVDVLNTMQNPDLPLTVTEYDEWGDPADPAAHARIRAYAPYENVTAQPYPAILAIAGYHDSRVQYWEAAKWVARLRATGTGTWPVLLKVDFDAGHGGMSGRYQVLRDAALESAFLLGTAFREAALQEPGGQAGSTVTP
ncbi:S9 family peptidase [Pseudomonas mangiferae]|uniref:S9 family peptidase n=1 Tax=Pseudomonas mangiferae TaxID=2593654 RepID=A0A553GUH7_9PSED|nr:S9 family peptidase [Pseudomonas mangiferae]TRX73170.1 S9 family peptidase [Pseudomonas mangiferae]